MESQHLNVPGDLVFYFDLLAVTETSRRMARVAMVLALKMSETDSPPASAGFMRRTLTASIPELLADAERAGVPADHLTTAAIEAWARSLYRDAETRLVLDGPWNYQEDLPQWMVDGTTFAEQVLGDRQG